MYEYGGTRYGAITPAQNAVDEAIGLTTDPRPTPDETEMPEQTDTGSSDGNPIDDRGAEPAQQDA